MRLFAIIPCVGLAVALSSLSGCKSRKTSAAVKAVDASLAELLDFSTLSEEKQRNYCSHRIFIAFYMNAEQGAQLIVDQPVDDGFTPAEVSTINNRQRQKDEYYFNLGKAAQQKMIARIGQIQKECQSKGSLKGNGETLTGSISIATIIDGPDYNDSNIELNQWLFHTPDSPESWQQSLKSATYRLNTATKTLEASSEKFEIFWPTDLSEIAKDLEKKFLAQENQVRKNAKPFKTFDFAMRIAKGHGFTTKPKFDDVRLAALLTAQPEELAWAVTELNSAMFFDRHNHEGEIPPEKSNYVIPAWSPKQICAYMARKDDNSIHQDIYQECLAKRQAQITAPFHPNSISGCGSPSQANTQGDEKQGDKNQGDEKQGEEKQGAHTSTFLQGLSGIDAEEGLSQGGKGATFLPRQIHAGKGVYAHLALGQGLALTPIHPLATSEQENIEQGRSNLIPIPSIARQEMMIFDTCTTNFTAPNSVPWISLSSAKWRDHPDFNGIVLYSPFSLSADAVRYETLSIHQYLLLAAIGHGDDASKREMLHTRLARGGFNGTDPSCKVFADIHECRGTTCFISDFRRKDPVRITIDSARKNPGFDATKRANLHLASDLLRDFTNRRDFSLRTYRDLIFAHGDVHNVNLPAVGETLRRLPSMDERKLRLFPEEQVQQVLKKLYAAIDKSIALELAQPEDEDKRPINPAIKTQLELLTAPFKSIIHFQTGNDAQPAPIAKFFTRFKNALPDVFRQRVSELVPIEHRMNQLLISWNQQEIDEYMKLRDQYYKLILAPLPED